MNVNLDLEPIKIPGLKDGKPILISGPCSAESEKQVMDTAKELKKMNISVFRAGIWKPRTRPNSFEGYGSVALPWLKKVKEETGMLVATEVANTWHVNEAINHGIDILWIGARTSANPFAMQEIANALRGLDCPVFIKNPVNPDVELWIGAIERVNKAGIKKIAAIHRGFSTYEKNLYRNKPQWEVPIELKRRIPELPVIVDPSHIAGNKDLLFSIAQRAMDLNLDGLFIESHNNPAKAMSDKDQQVTPKELKSLLEQIVYREENITDDELLDTLTQLRRQIDSYDSELLNLFERRMEISDSIGKYKKDHKITILQNSRWNEILSKRLESGIAQGLSADFLTKIFRAIHQESISRQNKVMN